MDRKSWGATWPECKVRPRAPGSRTQSALYNLMRCPESLVCRGGRGGPAPAHRGSGRIAPGGCPLPGAVLPHGAGRPARRFAEAFPARSGHFPERWRPFSGALGACSGRQPPMLRTFRSDRARDTHILSENSYYVREYSFRPGTYSSRTDRNRTDSGRKTLITP